MSEVGRRAGVSATTVSFVVNGQDKGITPATQQRVQDAINELGFRPNRTAQGLRTRRTQTIGFVTDEIAVMPPAGQTVAGAHDVAWAHRSLLLIVNTTRSPRIMRAAIDDLIDRRVDAIMVAVVGTRRISLPTDIRQVPCVLVNCYAAGNDFPCVLPDETEGGRAATQILLDAGHRRIAFLTGLPGAWATRARIKGHRMALTAAGIPPGSAVLRAGNFKADSGYALARELLTLSGPSRPTAFLCGNDRMAMGAYLALAEAGVRVPEEISVVGYDDQIDLAPEIHPALTSIRLPFYEMGHWAATQLFAGAIQQLPPRTYIQCRAVLRDSVGPPAAGAS
jgi:LacI family transcriptional regulator